MRRFILHSVGYGGSGIVCTVDDLDDIIGDEDIDAVDTQTGDCYVWKDDAWVKSGNADELKYWYLHRKSDPPRVATAVVATPAGGLIVPVEYMQAAAKAMFEFSPIPQMTIPIRDIDREIKIPALENDVT